MRCSFCAAPDLGPLDFVDHDGRALPVCRPCADRVERHLTENVARRSALATVERRRYQRVGHWPIPERRRLP